MSSGTSRTGTYIAVDTIIRLLDRSIDELSRVKLDIMGIVNQLKHDRINMVQTAEQYLLIYRCVEEYLRRINRLDTLMEISSDYEIIGDEIPNTSKNYYIDLSKPKDSSQIESQYVIDDLDTMQISITPSETLDIEQRTTDGHASHKYIDFQNENNQPPSKPSRCSTTQKF